MIPPFLRWSWCRIAGHSPAWWPTSKVYGCNRCGKVIGS